MAKRGFARIEGRADGGPRLDASAGGGILSSTDGLMVTFAKKIWDKIGDHFAEVIALALSGVVTAAYFLFVRKIRWVELQLGRIEVSALDAVLAAIATGTVGAALSAVVVKRGVRSTMDDLRLRISRMERESALEQTNEQKVRVAVEAAMSAAADESEALALVLIDVDDFRRLNNDYSYDVGSFVLRQVARLLASNIRGSRDRVMRYFERGDEFLVILPGTGIENAYQGVAERLRKLVKDTRFLLGDRPDSRGEFCELTISAGLTAYSPGDEWKDLRDRLVGALHEAKQHGKNRCVPIGSSPATESP